MKRKIKMKRKTTVKDKFQFAQAMGGMTPYPPTDCPSPRFFKGDDEVRWTDNYFCHIICRPKYCAENREYHKYIFRNKNIVKETKNETAN